MNNSLRHIWIGVFLSVFVLLGGAWAIYNDTRSQILALIKQQHAITHFHIEDFEKTEKTLIKMLSEHPNVQHYVATDRTDTESLFYDVLKGHNEIMQLRLIDTFGNELVRVDRLRDGTIKRCLNDELQNKANRYYFQEFMQLSKGSIGFSDFDLNIEHGKLDIPFNPTLRIGMPVYNKGTKTGIVVINFYMQDWIENLLHYTNNELMLIDRDGYFLIHPDKKWEWSRYQHPSRKAAEYFDLSPLELESMGNTHYHWINNDTVAVPLNLFGQKLLALYHPHEPVLKMFFQKNLQFVLIAFTSLALIVIPLIRMIRLYIRRIDEEKTKIKEGTIYLSTLLNSVFDAVIVIDQGGIIQRINNQALRLLGYKTEELVGKNVKIIIPEPYRSLHDGFIHNYISNKMDRKLEERHFDVLKSDGTFIPISLIVTHMRINDKIFFIGSIRDLTHIRELEKREKSNETMLIHQSKLAAMGELLGTVAHQWRQPLNSIGLIIQDLVLAFENDDLEKSYFKKSENEIMGQLLYMSKTIDEFRSFFIQEEAAGECNAIKLVSEIEALSRPQLEANNVRLHVHYGDGLEGVASGEDQDIFRFKTYPSEVKQILLNLISNSKEAIVALRAEDKMLRNTITITLSASETSIRIEVSDRAGGIGAEIADRIFEPYYTTKEKGVGLGLYICKILCERHLNAKLTFETDTDTGITIFILILPRTVQDQ